MRALAVAALLLCASFSVEGQIPQPIRETSYDWRCLGPSGVVSNHSRLDTAIYACQVAAAKSPGAAFYIEGGRYRIVAAVQTPAPAPAPAPVPTPTPTPTKGSATLAWTPPTQNTDGSPLMNLAGYRVYWGTAPGSYTNSTTLNNPGLANYTVDGLSSGAWYFVVTAFSSTGFESVFSNVASKTISF